MRKGSVAIIGCGWLGFELAKVLLAAGYTVKGSTRTPAKMPALKAAGIEPYLLNLPIREGLDSPTNDQDEALKNLFDTDQLVLNVPPGRNSAFAKIYPAALLSAVLAYRRSRSDGRIILTSSTGVYGREHKQWIDRDSGIPITNPTQRQAMLLLGESQVAVQAQRPVRILRLGGLYGGDRHPGKYIAQRGVVERPNEPANLVSRERVITEIESLLSVPFWSGKSCYNIVDPIHRTRAEIYGPFMA